MYAIIKSSSKLTSLSLSHTSNPSACHRHHSTHSFIHSSLFIQIACIYVCARLTFCKQSIIISLSSELCVYANGIALFFSIRRPTVSFVCLYLLHPPVVDVPLSLNLWELHTGYEHNARQHICQIYRRGTERIHFEDITSQGLSVSVCVLLE